MQFKLAVVSLALATLAAATPARRESACTTGGLQCCHSVQPANNTIVTRYLKHVGVVLKDLNVSVGISCSPITVVGVGSGTCTAHAACCEDNSHGLISIDCVPVQI